MPDKKEKKSRPKCKHCGNTALGDKTLKDLKCNEKLCRNCLDISYENENNNSLPSQPNKQTEERIDKLFKTQEDIYKKILEMDNKINQLKKSFDETININDKTKIDKTVFEKKSLDTDNCILNVKTEVSDLNNKLLQLNKDLLDFTEEYKPPLDYNVPVRNKFSVLNDYNTERYYDSKKVNNNSSAPVNSHSTERILGIKNEGVRRKNKSKPSKTQVLLIGDSGVKGQAYNFCPGKTNRLINTNTDAVLPEITNNLESKIRDTTENAEVVIQFGTEDVRNHPTGDIKKEIRFLINKIMTLRENRTVKLVSVLPHAFNQHINYKIKTINRYIQDMCHRNKLGFIDISAKFSDRYNLYYKNGVYLNKKGKILLGKLLTDEIKNNFLDY